MHTREEQLQAVNRLLDILDELRVKCPWDKKQTFDSLKNLTVEEMYELVDAITEGDTDEMKKELGDLLMHIVFYA
ncbi:MAG: MazG nucleotide pyrophosphohydrolase domain-containing protein, partial [Flavobacterium sp.]